MKIWRNYSEEISEGNIYGTPERIPRAVSADLYQAKLLINLSEKSKWTLEIYGTYPSAIWERTVREFQKKYLRHFEGDFQRFSEEISWCPEELYMESWRNVEVSKEKILKEMWYYF